MEIAIGHPPPVSVTARVLALGPNIHPFEDGRLRPAHTPPASLLITGHHGRLCSMSGSERALRASCLAKQGQGGWG